MNHYASNMFFNKGGRHYWLAKYLKRNGYDPVVFCCNAKHGVKETYFETTDLWMEVLDIELNIPFVFVKAPLYSSNGIDRFINMVGFYVNVKKTVNEYASIHGKPDVIYASSVHPLTLIAGIQLAKELNIKCICEVRDLWPESIITYSTRWTKTNPIMRILYEGEKWIYKQSDALIFTMAGGKDYIIDNCWDLQHGGPIDLSKVYHINNGVDLELFDFYAFNNHFSDSDLNNDKFKVIYAGSIRKVNDIGLLLDVAKRLDSENILFIIYGTGDELQVLQERVRTECISNVVFKGKVDKSFIPSIIKRADINIVHWKASALLRYGDSSNKSFEYYAAGKPVLYTTKPNYSVVEEYDCGIVAENQFPETISSAILSIKGLTETEYKTMCINARRAAEDYDFMKLAQQLINIVESL